MLPLAAPAAATDAASPGADPAMERAVHAAAVTALYGYGRSTTFGAVVMALYLVLASLPYTDERVVAGWAAVVSVFLAARVAITARYARLAAAGPPRWAVTRRWERRFAAMQVVAGLVWGSTAFLFAHPDRQQSVVLTLLVLAAGASGAVTAQAYSPRSFRLFVGTMMGAVVLRFLVAGGRDYLVLAAAWACYAVTLVGYNRLQAASVRDTLRIRFEREAALAQAAAEREAADAARQRAEQASLAKSRFLAAASHDLRQPLYALGLFSASLETLRLDAGARAVVNGVSDSIRVMETLFESLLDLSKLEAGAVAPAPRPVAVDAVFDRLSQVFRPIARDRGLELRLRHDGEWVLSDPALLEQVLANLVSNALRATRPRPGGGGGVLVAARRRPGAVRLEVWDTGVGIAPDQLEAIFEEFVQLDNPERDRRKGLGLGLAIARRGAALLGAPVGVWSRPGRGSCFALAQPAVAAPAAAPTSPTPTPTPMPASAAAEAPALLLPGLPVLVVDDEGDVRRALGDLLARWGVAHRLAADAAGARAAAAAGPLGLVLADQRLGAGPDGLALVAELREGQPGLPAALVTADLDQALVARARAMAVPLLHKPLRPERLAALLGRPGPG